MRFLTPRKTAAGLGASGAAASTMKHWQMTISSVALAILTPAFLLVLSNAIGLSRPEVLAYFARPYPAIVTALFLVIGMNHFMHGTRIMIDDYLHHTERKVAVVFSELFSWAVIAAAVYALARMALSGTIV